MMRRTGFWTGLWAALAAAAMLMASACGGDAEPSSPPSSTVAPPATMVAPATPAPAPTTPPAAGGTPAEPALASTPAPLPTAVPAPTPTPAPDLAGVPGIVDPSNFGWPRIVEGLNGQVVIPAQPMRIITASIGHDEVALALVPAERLVAVGAVSKDPVYSNVAALVAGKPEVSRDPETIVSQSPDVVVTSPWFAAEGVEALTRIGVPVVQTALGQSIDDRINQTLLMGYILGEEERAAAFAAELRARHDALLAVTAPAVPKPLVLSVAEYAETLWVAGAGSLQGGLILDAGGVNAAAAVGVEGDQTVSAESLIAMAPEVIIIPQPRAFGAEEFRQRLLEDAAFAAVPAVAAGRVHIVDSKLYSTLSHWNIAGAEDLAALLWPGVYAGPAESGFSAPEAP